MSIVIVTGSKLLASIFAKTNFGAVLPAANPGSGRLWLDSSGAVVIGEFEGNDAEPIQWGAIEGTLSDQADLQALLDNCAEPIQWGSIVGTLSAQADLQVALDNCVATNGDTMTGEFIVDRSFAANQRLVTAKIAGTEIACLRAGSASNQGGELNLGNGSEYVLLQYAAGFPKLVTSRNNFTVQTSVAQFRFSGTYIDYLVGATQVFLLQFAAASPVLKLKQAASGQTHLELTNTAGTNEFFVENGGHTAFSGSLRIGAFTVATMPGASANTGRLIRLTDRSHRHAYSDGSNWKFVSGDTIVS